MSKKGPDAPPPAPNPYAVAAAQTQGDVNSAIANSIIGNPNERGPTGSVTYNQVGTTHLGGTGGGGAGGGAGGLFGGIGSALGLGGGGDSGYDIPRYERVTTLSPEQQQLYDQQTQLGSSLNNLAIGQTNRLTDVLGKPLDTSGINPIQSSYNTTQAPTSFGPTDFTADRNAVTDATMARYRPQLDIDQNSLDAKLANQGLSIGSQAWSDAQATQGRQRDDAYSSAVLAGANEQNQLFNQKAQEANYGLSAINQNNNTNANKATFGNQAASQQLQAMLAERNQPINEISSLMSGGQVSMPQFAGYNAPTVANSTVGQNVYNSAALDQQNYQSQVSQSNAAMGGLFGLGSAGLYGLASGGLKAALPALAAVSDRRYKTDIERIGTYENGLPVYAFRYAGSPHLEIGFMADEVEQLRPDAVIEFEGVKMVNYDRAMELA